VLIDLAKKESGLCQKLKSKRALLAFAAAGNAVKLEKALLAEERAERDLLAASAQRIGKTTPSPLIF
jgi:hypothetical protein